MSDEQVYGYRTYFIGENGLLPLFFKHTQNGIAVDDGNVTGAPEALVDLFGWTHSDDHPQIGEESNWVNCIMPKPFDEYVNLWDEGTDKGLYSFNTLRHALLYTGDMGLSFIDHVLAKVQLAGFVVEHENGYRASMTRIVELYSPLDEDRRGTIAERIGWPFEVTHIDAVS